MIKITLPEPPAIHIYKEGFFGLYRRGPICHLCKKTLKQHEIYGGKCDGCKNKEDKN